MSPTVPSTPVTTRYVVTSKAPPRPGRSVRRRCTLVRFTPNGLNGLSLDTTRSALLVVTNGSGATRYVDDRWTYVAWKYERAKSARRYSPLPNSEMRSEGVTR